jgi:hypothetical protein
MKFDWCRECPITPWADTGCSGEVFGDAFLEAFNQGACAAFAVCEQLCFALPTIPTG